MAAVAEVRKARPTIPMRVKPAVRDLIDRAAALSGKSRTEFILESAQAQAINVLLDQRLFQLDEEQMEAFEAALHSPPKPNAALKTLMRNKAPWE